MTDLLDPSSVISSIQDKLPPFLLNTATALGLYKMFRFTFTFGSFLWRHFMRPIFRRQNHMYVKYADIGQQGSWAVITGGSDGIGLALCKNLAR